MAHAVQVSNPNLEESENISAIVQCILVNFPRLEFFPEDLLGKAVLWAARNNQLSIIQLIIKSDIVFPVNLKDQDGWTPLMWLVLRGKQDLMQNILDRKKGILTKEEQQQLPEILDKSSLPIEYKNNFKKCFLSESRQLATHAYFKSFFSFWGLFQPSSSLSSHRKNLNEMNQSKPGSGNRSKAEEVTEGNLRMVCSLSSED